MSIAARHRRVFVCLLAAALAGALHARGQTVDGRISGTVFDESGAAVPGATVTARHEATGLLRSAATDLRGGYVLLHLPIGTYVVSAELTGFKKSVKSGYELVADGRVTVDFRLVPGALSETIEVVAEAGETVNTVSGELARVVDREQVQNLALNGRNYMQLANLIPGAPVLNDDALDIMTNLSINTSINGGRTNANSLAVDGGFNMDSGSNNSQISNVGVDFIQEVNIKTAAFSAEYGRNSGASINVVTRSGGNKFDGGVWEYLRDERLDANNYFLKQRGVAKAPLDYNNFGYRLGGPLRRDKLFFFVGQEWKQIRRFTAATRRTLPTRAERRGDFGSRSFTVNDPLTGQPFPGNVIPPNRITTDGRAIANVYDAMEKLARAYADTPTANNALFQGDNPFDLRQDMLRLDWRVDGRHSVYARLLRDNYDLIDPFGTFINSQLPTIPTNRVRPGRNYQVGHTWIIDNNLTHELRVTGSWNGQRIPPVGDAWKRESYGFEFPQLFTGGGRFEDSIPIVSVTGFASFQGASASLLSPTTDIAFANSVTWRRSRHVLKAGLTLIRNRKDQNGRSDYTGNVAFSTGGNTNTTGNAFADALLGNFRTYTEAESDPVGFFRFTQLDAYLTDNWKIGPRLSVEIGVRYQYHLPIHTQANNIANFDPRRYDPARAIRVDPRSGNLVLGSGERYSGILRAGGGIPEDELIRVPSGRSAEVLAVPAGAPRGLYDAAHSLMPRVSFAWALSDDGRTALRGGFGVYYDRPEGNIIFSQVNLPPYSGSARFENGNLAAPSGGRAGAVGPLGTINAIDPELDVPKTLNWSLSLQRELWRGIFAEAAYVGSLGRDLLRQPDINAIPFEALRANRALPTAQRASENALRPYLGYTAIRMRLSDAESNYHALQLYAAKRRGDLRATLSYTFGKALANASGNGDQLDVGEDPYEGLRNNYGPTSYDRRQILVGTWTYRLPVFRKKKGAAGSLLSGWEVSGITRYQSGRYWTVTGTTSIGTRRADYLGGPIALASSERHADRWFNTAAFAPAPDDRRGNAGVGLVQAPSRSVTDLSLRKRFKLRRDARMTVQMDLFNAFDQVNFGDPNVNVSSADFGTISSAGPARNVQLGVRLDF